MSVVLPSAVIETCATQIANLASRHEHSRPIVGVFDSGVGGLTVLPALHAPTQIFDSYYLGDTAHFPYGEKTEAELVPLVLADIAHLVTAGCSLVGIACNTASIVWNELLTQLPEPVQQQAKAVVLDTISTTMQALAQVERRQTIGIIGTSFTVQSGAYRHAIERQFPHARPVILQSAEQSLVNAIEHDDPDAIKQELERIMHFFSAHDLDVFILGCTHYGHIAQAIKSALPPHVVMLDPSVLLGQALRSLALAHISPRSFPSTSTTLPSAAGSAALLAPASGSMPPTAPAPQYQSVITFTGATPTTSVY